MADTEVGVPDKRGSNAVKRSGVIIAIMIPIALLHLVTGSTYDGPFPTFVNGYLLDICIPFGFYFLAGQFLKHQGLCRRVRAGAVMVLASGVEIIQSFGIPLLGSTFDWFDFFAYAAGIGLAVLFDLHVFSRIFPFWTNQDVNAAKKK